MRFLMIILTILFFSQSFAVDQVKEEICNLFAEENYGVVTESDYEGNDIEVYYDKDLAFEHCMANAEPEKKTDGTWTYYEFELFVCGGSYQDETIAYDPVTKTLEYLGASGSGDECPYAFEE